VEPVEQLPVRADAALEDDGGEGHLPGALDHPVVAAALLDHLLLHGAFQAGALGEGAGDGVRRAAAAPQRRCLHLHVEPEGMQHAEVVAHAPVPCVTATPSWATDSTIRSRSSAAA